MSYTKELCERLREDAWHHAADAIERLEKERDTYKYALTQVRDGLRDAHMMPRTVAELDKLIGDRT